MNKPQPLCHAWSYPVSWLDLGAERETSSSFNGIFYVPSHQVRGCTEKHILAASFLVLQKMWKRLVFTWDPCSELSAWEPCNPSLNHHQRTVFLSSCFRFCFSELAGSWGTEMSVAQEQRELELCCVLSPSLCSSWRVGSKGREKPPREAAIRNCLRKANSLKSGSLANICFCTLRPVMFKMLFLPWGQDVCALILAFILACI